MLTLILALVCVLVGGLAGHYRRRARRALAEVDLLELFVEEHHQLVHRFARCLVRYRDRLDTTTARDVLDDVLERANPLVDTTGGEVVAVAEAILRAGESR